MAEGGTSMNKNGSTEKTTDSLNSFFIVYGSVCVIVDGDERTAKTLCMYVVVIVWLVV